MPDIRIEVHLNDGVSQITWRGMMKDDGDWIRFRRYIEERAQRSCTIGSVVPEVRSVRVKFPPLTAPKRKTK